MELDADGIRRKDLFRLCAAMHRIPSQCMFVMLIYLNDKEIDVVENTTLGQLLAAQNLTGPGIAAAVDAKVVRRPDRDAFILTEDCKVVVFKAVCGG